MLKGKLFDGGLLFLAIVTLFGYGVSLLERAADETGSVDKAVVKEIIDSDIDYVTDKASEYYAESKVLYPDGYNQEWYASNVNH